MADTIVDGTLFNAENIRYTSPKAGGSGGKSVNILNKSSNTGLRLSTPLMLTWGAADYVDASTGKGNGKYEMSLVFPNDEYKDDDTTSFLTNMQNLEKKIKADALTNSKEWFGKVHKNAEVVDALYSPMLKYTKDKNTGEADMSKSPLLKVKIPLWDGVWKCEVYDEDGAKLFPNPSNPTVSPLDLIQKGSQVAVIMQCGGLWFANGKFGITWKLVQALVGDIYLVVLDVRDNSPTYGKWESYIISEKTRDQVLVPPGFANGHYALTDCMFHYNLFYKDGYVDADEQGVVKWNDPEYQMEWPTDKPILQKRDK
jgi:hypothetical protein